MLSQLGHAFEEGGWGMWPILFWSIITVGIIVERAIALNKAKLDKDAFVAALRKSLLAGDVGQAIKLCSAADRPLSRIIKAGLLRVNKADDEVQAAMDESALLELPLVEKRTGYLAMLANLAMLSGLLGTVTGLIQSFAAVAGVDPSAKATMLAKGISEAMNCTAFGLIVALLGLIGFSLLNGVTQGLIDDINAGSVQVMNLVVTNREKLEVPKDLAAHA